jgi:hypothetical protein
MVGEMVVVSVDRKNIRKSLAATAARRVGTTIDKNIEHGHWMEELTDKQVEYATDDVISLPAIYRAQLQKAADTGQVDALILEQSIMPYVAKMTINGLPCYKDKMLEFIKQQRALLNSMDYEARRVFGDINFNSHTQIKKAVHDRYGLTWASTAHSFLLDLIYDDPASADLAQLLVNYRLLHSV